MKSLFFENQRGYVMCKAAHGLGRTCSYGELLVTRAKEWLAQSIRIRRSKNNLYDFFNIGYCRKRFPASITKSVKLALQVKQSDKPIDYIDMKNIESSMANYEHNSFVIALRTAYDDKQIERIIQQYMIGTNRDGTCIFWQIDISGKGCYAKAFYFHPNLYEYEQREHFVSNSYYQKFFNHRQVFFGEHLLASPENIDKPVYIFESEMTACIASECFPEYVCLATGNGDVKLTDESVWTSLANRKVILYSSNVKSKRTWNNIAGKIRSFGIDVTVNETLYKLFPDVEMDVSDMIIYFLKSQRRQQEAIAAENATENAVVDNSVVISENSAEEAVVDNPVVASKVEKTIDETLPEYKTSGTKDELCRQLGIDSKQFDRLIKKGKIKYLEPDRYSLNGILPF